MVSVMKVGVHRGGTGERHLSIVNRCTRVAGVGKRYAKLQRNKKEGVCVGGGGRWVGTCT